MQKNQEDDDDFATLIDKTQKIVEKPKDQEWIEKDKNNSDAQPSQSQDSSSSSRVSTGQSRKPIKKEMMQNLHYKLTITKNFKDFMKTLNIEESNPLFKYYNGLFDELIENKIDDYTQKGKLKYEYTFKHHFKLLIDQKRTIQCHKCWSFNHKTASHLGNIGSYDNPCRVIKHIPLINLKEDTGGEEMVYYCPYGTRHFQYNKEGQIEFFKHLIEIHKDKGEIDADDAIRISSTTGKQLAEEEKKLLGPDQLFRYRISYLVKNLHKAK